MGSYARGRADLFTDLDLLVVMETNLSFIDRLRMLYPLLALPVDLDLLCYTPEELERMQDRPFIKHLRRDEVVLYEAPGLREQHQAIVGTGTVLISFVNPAWSLRATNGSVAIQPFCLHGLEER